jgi:hypothetical protein
MCQLILHQVRHGRQENHATNHVRCAEASRAKPRAGVQCQLMSEIMKYGLHTDTLLDKSWVLADMLRSHFSQTAKAMERQVSIVKLLRGCLRATVYFDSMGHKRQAPEVMKMILHQMRHGGQDNHAATHVYVRCGF